MLTSAENACAYQRAVGRTKVTRPLSCSRWASWAMVCFLDDINLTIDPPLAAQERQVVTKELQAAGLPSQVGCVRCL